MEMKIYAKSLHPNEEAYLRNLVNFVDIRKIADEVPTDKNGHINPLEMWKIGSRSITNIGNIPPEMLVEAFGARPNQMVRQVGSGTEEKVFYFVNMYSEHLPDHEMPEDKASAFFLNSTDGKDMRFYFSERLGNETLRMIAAHLHRQLMETIKSPYYMDKYNMRVGDNGVFVEVTGGFSLKTELEW